MSNSMRILLIANILLAISYVALSYTGIIDVPLSTSIGILSFFISIGVIEIIDIRNDKRRRKIR